MVYVVAELYRIRASVAVFAAGVFLGTAMLAFLETVRGRKSRDHIQAEVLRSFFSQVHGELFPEDQQLRITLFRRCPYSSEYIVPWFRYTPGGGDLINEAKKSRAKYRIGEGFTGYAWQNAGTEIIIASFPEFKDRESFESYYTRTLRIDADTVKKISNEMVRTRTVLSHGFQDSRENFLGVLSVDLHAPLEVDAGKHPRIGAVRIHSDVMVQLLNSIENVLEAFARMDEKSQ
jgi:hypothetical protein